MPNEVSKTCKSLGFLLNDTHKNLEVFNEDRIVTTKVIFYPSLIKDPLSFLSCPTTFGGEVYYRVFFIGLLGHCFVCGKEGPLAG